MTEASPCALHPHEAVIGACQRCGDFICRLCLKGKRLVCAKCAPAGDVKGPELVPALRYAFNDPDWFKKIAIGGLCFIGGALFVLPLFILMGYGMRVARQEEQQPRERLPEWDEVGDLFGSGFKFWIAQLIPTSLIFFVIFALIAAGFGLAILGGAASSAPGASPVGAVIGTIGFFGAIFLLIPVSFFLSFFMPAVHVHYVRTGRITAGLELRAIWGIASNHFSEYLVLFVFHFLVQMIGTFVGELACGIGLFMTIPWMMIVQGYLVGRYAGWLDAEDGPPAS